MAFRIVLGVILLIWLSGCSSPAYIKHNDLLVAQGRTQEAAENYNELIEKDLEDPELHYRLAKVYLTTKSLKQAKSAIDKAVLLDPLIARYRLLAGKIYYQTADYFEAINHLINSLIINNRLLESYQLLALAYEKIEQPDKALQQLEVAISIEPMLFEPHWRWVSIKFEKIKKQLSESSIQASTESSSGSSGYEKIHQELSSLIMKLETTLKIKPKSVEGNLLLSEIYFTMGAVYKAKVVLQDWLDDGSVDDRILLALAKIEYKAGNYVTANQLLKRQLKPSLASSIFRFRVHKKIAPASDLKPEILKLQTEHPYVEELYLLLADMEYQEGNLLKAERLVQKSLKLNPKFAEAYFTLSNIFEIQNDLLGAQWAIRKALELAPTNFEFQILYLRWLVEEKKWTEASNFISQYQANPENLEIVFLQGVIAKEQGNYAQAVQFFHRAQRKQYSVDIEVQLADIEVREGKFHAAEKRLRRIGVFSPDNMDIALIKAKQFMRMKQIQKIPPLLYPYLENPTAKGKIHLPLAEVLVQLDRLQDAMDILNQGIKQWPRHPEIAQVYTLYLGLTEQYEKAIEILEDMQSFKHKYSQLFYYRLRAYYFRAGEMDKFKNYIHRFSLEPLSAKTSNP